MRKWCMCFGREGGFGFCSGGYVSCIYSFGEMLCESCFLRGFRNLKMGKKFFREKKSRSGKVVNGFVRR